MQTINLDPEFTYNGYISDLHYSKFKFSAGEVHVKRVGGALTDEVRIVHRLNSSDNIMELLLCADALRKENPQIVIHTFFPYFPYARQDRVVVNGEPFSLEVFLGLLKTANFNSIGYLDAHSNKTKDLLSDARINNYSILPSYLRDVKQDILDNFGEFVLVAPDKGARAKIYENAKYIDYSGPIYCANKVRDGNTGKITDMELDCENGILDGKVIWVQDDIASRANTFIILAKILKEKGAKIVVLSVSHYEDVADENMLAQYIDKVYSTNSISNKESKLVKKFKL